MLSQEIEFFFLLLMIRKQYKIFIMVPTCFFLFIFIYECKEYNPYGRCSKHVLNANRNKIVCIT